MSIAQSDETQGRKDPGTKAPIWEMLSRVIDYSVLVFMFGLGMWWIWQAITVFTVANTVAASAAQGWLTAFLCFGMYLDTKRKANTLVEEYNELVESSNNLVKKLQLRIGTLQSRIREE